MYKNAASLHTLVDQLLYVQKIEAGMVRLQLSETDLVQLVCNVSEPFRQMAEIKGLQDVYKRQPTYTIPDSQRH